MTDEQLLDLIETKSPEELTLAEIEELRRRLTESPMLRAAFTVRIEMEQYLAAALGRVNVSVDEIMNRAGQAPVLRANPALPVLGWVLCLVLVGFVGLVLLLTLTIPPAADAKRAVAAREAGDSAARPGDKVQDEPTGEKPTDPADDSATPTEPDTQPPATPLATNTPPATPPAAPPPTPAGPKEPWDVLAAAEDAPRPSSMALFSEVDRTVAPPREEELKQWFSKVANQPHAASHKDFWGVSCGVLDGVWRLRAPSSRRRPCGFPWPRVTISSCTSGTATKASRCTITKI